MTLSDRHVHTTFSDGKNTPEEMVRAAIALGMEEIGFSDHSYTFFDESYCIGRGKTSEYKKEILRLKEKYRGKINVLLGIEQDYYSTESTDGFDYVIGSVHYFKTSNGYFDVDASAESLINTANTQFGGDFYAMAEFYFNTVASFAVRDDVGIIGHFDLIIKFNARRALFDEENPRYEKAWKRAADILISAGKIFEINTGAISRGYTQEPYPSDVIRKYIALKGGKFILSSDSHRAETLCFGFDKIKL